MDTGDETHNTLFHNNLVRRKYMNKKLLAVAIGAALSAPMFAQADVKIGGQAHVSADYVDTITSAANDQAKVWNIASNVSNIFFKAEEDLGGGLKGVFFLQEYFRLDDNGGTTTAGSTNRMHDAPAYAGLASDSMGTVLLGNQDGPSKLAGRAVDLFGNAIGDSRNTGLDNTRFQNAISYTSPKFGPVTVVYAHSTNVDNGIVNPVSGGAAQTYGDAVLVKVGVAGLDANVAYHQAVNRTSTAAIDDNKVMTVSASYKIAGARIVGLYQNQKAVGFSPTTDRDVYGIGGSYTFGNETVKVQYYNVTNKNATDVSSSVMALGFDHKFSKTVTGYVAIAAASNDLGNSIGMAAGGGHGDSPANYSGGDQNGLSLGMIYNF
jgi:predicted porin